MAGSRPIQVIPAGLLGFLQLKNQGKNPVELADSVQPGLEMFDWYVQSQSEIFSVSRAGIASGSDGQFSWSTALKVPDGEWWYLIDYTIFATMGAGDTISLGCSIKYETAQVYLLIGAQTDSSTGPDKQVTALMDRPRWLAPTTELTGTIGQITQGTGFTISGGGRFTRFPI